MNVPYTHAEGGARDPGAGGTGARPAPEAGDRRPAQGLGLRLRADGQRPLRPDPVPGAAHLPARPRRRADALDRLARRGAGARVHLALPNQNGFFREQQKPSASVLLTLHPGRTLDRAQIAGIVHLVSSSVPELSPKAVSVLDQSGALLSGSADARHGAGLDAQQLQYVEPDRGRLHQAHPRAARADRRPRQPARQRHRRHRLLADRGDLGGVQAEPGRRRERLDPQPADAPSRAAAPAARSPAACPGAASNQPPIAATAPLTGASQPLQARAERRRRAAAAAGARRSPTTRSTRRCA